MIILKTLMYAIVILISVALIMVITLVAPTMLLERFGINGLWWSGSIAVISALMVAWGLISKPKAEVCDATADK